MPVDASAYKCIQVHTATYTYCRRMTSNVLQKVGVSTPKQLYKFLMRECEKLPRDAQQFYKYSVRQSFKQHVSEPDPERVQQIMEKAVTDSEWIIQKYCKDTPSDTNKK